MRRIQTILIVITVLLALILISCSGDTRNETNQDQEKISASRDEHQRESGESGDQEGEESGTELTLEQTYNKVRNGAHLIMTYDAESNSFVGTVENTTEKTLKNVRVEVHLSNGKELGPTTPVNLEPGKKIDVELKASDKDFDSWTAHPEVGSNEHGRSEHDTEHEGTERDGEHDRESGEEHEGEHGERD